jgi:hypothetical protein
MNGKTVWREEYPGNEIELLGDAMGALLVSVFEKIGHDKIFRSCATCRNWIEGAGCKVYHALPPVKIIVCGCDKYDDNAEIPF